MKIFILALLLCLSLLTSSCTYEPTPEQLNAQANVQRQAQFEAEQQAKIQQSRADEDAGDAALGAGQQQQALNDYLLALQDAPPAIDLTQALREKIIQFVQKYGAPTGIPEDVRAHAVRANAYFKESDYTSAVSEMQQAVMVVPWWADGYYNLGLMQEGASNYASAISSFRLFLLAAPSSSEAVAVRNKIYELQVKKEDEDKKKSLAGDWYDTDASRAHFSVKVEGDKLEIQADSQTYNGGNGWTGAREGCHYSLVIKGNTLDGTRSTPATNWSNPFVNGLINPTVNVSEPAQLVPCTGTISPDGATIELEFIWTSYQVSTLGASALGKQQVKFTMKHGS